MTDFKRQKIQTGKIGEDIAVDYLKKNKFKIVERNWKNKYGEIDIVANKNKKLHFIEVRTRIGEEFGTPEDSLNFKKRKRIERNARIFAAFINYQKQYYIGYICIVLDRAGNCVRISYYEQNWGSIT